MTHFDLNEMSIKTEPLSPNTAEQLMTHLTPSPIPDFSHSPALGVGMTGPPTFAATPSTDTRNALKSSILSKRKLRGETSLPSTNDGPREYKLTKREIERKEARKEQNRRAAKKCRIKKKTIQEYAENEMQTARKENVEMKHEVRNLRQQIVHLQKIISDHESSPNCKLTTLHSTCNGRLQSNTSTAEPRQYLSGPMAPIVGNSPCTPFHHVSQSPQNLPEIVLSNATEVPSEKLPPESFLFPHSDSPSFLHQFTNDNNMHSDPGSVHSNLPSWDLKNLNSDILDQEVPEGLIESLIVGGYDMGDYETPKTDGEIKVNEKTFSCPASTETPITFMPNKTTNSKPPVVRNLNCYFTQTDLNTDFPKSQQQQHTRKNVPPPLKLNKQNTNGFLLDPNLSSPIFSCVSPNLVQPNSKIPTGNVQTVSIQPSNARALSSYTPFENQVIAQNTHSLMHIEPRDSNETGLFEPVSNTFEDNQQNHISLDACHGICESNSYPIPPPETALQYCSSNNSHRRNGEMFSPSGSNNSPGFAYSPISVSSPSNVSNVSSPGFLLSPQHELCSFEFNGFSQME